MISCGICGQTVASLLRLRQHQFALHYDYVLEQCNYDKKLLKEWVDMK